jgi:CHAT domain
MSASLASELIQRVVSNRGMPSSAGAQVPPAPSGREIYFELEITDPTEELDPFARALAEEKAEPRKLLPGHKYLVRVSATSYRQGDSYPVYAIAPLKLLLCCQEVPGIGISDATRTIAPEEIESLDEEFELSVPAECPRGDYRLALMYYLEDNKRPKARTIYLDFSLEGTHNPVDQNLQTTCRIKLNDQPPEHTAILHIEAPAPDQYRMTGWSKREKPLKTGLMQQPTMGLANFIEANLDPAYIRGSLIHFSRRSSEELLDWFHELYQRHGDQLCLIIADHSVSEFPWEMMQIKDGKYLGAVWKVVRWIPVRSFRDRHELCLQEEERTGEVLAYLNHKELDTDLERVALNHLATSYYETTASLKQGLSQPLDTVALVYLGCHGVFAAGAQHKIALGELENPSGQLVSLNIEDIESQEGARPLLFVNACHSARLARDTNGFYGLPEVFLARVASAYLGTLGPVGSSYAAKMANLIFTEAIEKSIEPAEVLRRLRAEAVAELAESEATENWLNFIYTFMYVYYGNPFAKIKLTCVAEPEGDA